MVQRFNGNIALKLCFTDFVRDVYLLFLQVLHKFSRC
jgi:hypothetical protein